MIDLTVLNTNTAATSVTSNSVFVGDGFQCIFQAIFSGSDVVGTINIQYSLDNINFFGISSTDTYAITDSTGIITAGYPVAKYMRLKWTYTSGTGNITAYATISNGSSS